MKKSVLLGILVIILVLPFSFASIEDEIQKLTHYAEDYEAGNINYVKLMVYSSAIREKLNEELGATSNEMGGLLKQDKIRKILGEPTEETKWVWIEKEEHETKLDEPVPRWKKIIFDGKKIQIRLEIHPTIFKKSFFYEEFERFEEKKDINGNLKQELKEEQERKKKAFENEFGFDEKGMALIYRLNFNIDFKKPEEQLDIKSKVDEIKDLAEVFNSESSDSNAKKLAKKCINVEKAFRDHFKQQGGDCESIMNSIFGSENKRNVNKIYVQENEFYLGNNFEAIARLETCDDCEWNWINVDIRIEHRGPSFKNFEKEEYNKKREKQSFEDRSEIEFKENARELVDKIKNSLIKENYQEAFSYSEELRHLNDMWNRVSNDVWDDVEKKYPNEIMAKDKKNKENRDPYFWIEREIEKRNYAEQLKKENYNSRKNFYLDLFSELESDEFYFEQIEWEKMLVEDYKEIKHEICDNGQDDDEDGKIDCNDEHCGGKICGWTDIEVSETLETEIIDSEEVIEEFEEVTDNVVEVMEEDENSESIVETENSVSLTSAVISGNNDEKNEVETEDSEKETKKVPMFCIEKKCKIRNEDLVVRKSAVCGNHNCESGENSENCPEDCSVCDTKTIIECSEGSKAIYSGKDKFGCPLNPVCIDKEEKCETKEDCKDPLCGEADCVDSVCKIVKLDECKDKECIDGNEKMRKCPNGDEIIDSVCENGLWINIDLACIDGSEGEEIDEEKEIVGDECETKAECGGNNDVCSNGKCVAIIEKIEGEKGEVVKIKQKEERKEIEKDENKEQDKESEKIEESEEVEEEKEEPESNEEEVEEENVPEPEPEAPAEESNEITGNVIFGFFRVLTNFVNNPVITGFAVEEEVTEDEKNSEDSSEEIIEDESENDNEEEVEEEVIEEVEHYDEQDDNWEEERRREEERREEDERKKQEKRCKEDCERNCRDRLEMPCINDCVFKNNQNKNEVGDLEECKKECREKVDISECVDNCIDNCIKGTWEKFEKQFKDKEKIHKEEVATFSLRGECRTSQGKTEGHIHFGGGGLFEEVSLLKKEYFDKGNEDWCKWELENVIKQRKEIEKGFNQEFAKWFFEKYLANSANDWEQHVSGIFELYWKNVEISREMARTMLCLEKYDIDEIMDYEIKEFKYESDYGSIEYWEEVKEVRIENFDEEVRIISPYMKIWIFPPKEFIIYEMKESMKKQEFPGSPEEKMERKNEDGLTEREKEEIRNDRGFMNKIRKISDKYGGSFDGSVQIIDSGNIIFNIYVNINEEDILKIKPMLPEEVPEKDVTVKIDFEKIYELIEISEKDMKGAHIESPPWDRKPQVVQSVKNVFNGMKMFFKVLGIVNSAEVTPESAEKDVNKLIRSFIWMMIAGGEDENPETEKDNEKEVEEIWDNKNMLTGEVILK